MRIIVSIIIALVWSTAMAAPTGIGANQIRTAQPNAVDMSGVAVAEGNSLSASRADHTHPITGILQPAHGGTGVSNLNCPAGQVLTSNGSVFSCVAAAISAYARASVPACDATTAAQEIRVHDAGQSDETWVCIRRDTTYAWSTYSMAANSNAAVMADGTLIATVGVVWTSAPSGDACVNQLTSVSTLGAAHSGECVNPRTDVYGTYTWRSTAMWMAVGATNKFYGAEIRLTGSIPVTFGPASTPDNYQCGAGGGEDVCNYDTPYDVVGYSRMYPCALNSTTCWIGATTYTGWRHYSAVNTVSSRKLIIKSSPMTASGTVIWSSAAGVNAITWNKGWNLIRADNVNPPAGINADDYYWVVIKRFDFGPWYSCTGPICLPANNDSEALVSHPASWVVTKVLR
jgi:hypothetical protein